MKDKNIVRYSQKTLLKGKTQWEKLRSMPEEEIERSAKADPENPRWTKSMLSSATYSVLK